MTTRLIVSFIGRMDLACFGLDDGRPVDADDQSPIVRLLLHLAEQGLLQPRQARLLLFDDHPDDGKRARWCEQLLALLPQIGVGGMQVDLVEGVLPNGPNDVKTLYELVFGTVPTTRPQAADEVLFHISSGAWGMQSTLMLAACCLPLKSARLFETSREAGVREVELPYVLFARETRNAQAGRARLSDAARRKLQPDTVIDDAAVERAYAELARSAANKRAAPALMVSGPSGSGKWHAAMQFARWRGVEPVTWTLPGVQPSTAQDALVLIWRLDAWDAEALRALSAWRVERRDVTMVATWRTDVPAAADMHSVARDGLRGAAFVHLPALSARSDIVALGEAVARQAGLWSGKVAQRLQYELGTDVYAHNLHDLKQVLVMADLHSKDKYPDAHGWLRATQIADTAQREALLREAFDTLANLRFGPARPGLTLASTLELVKALVVQQALAQGRTQKEAGALLGYEQTGISEIVNRELDLRSWHALLPAGAQSAGDADAR